MHTNQFVVWDWVVFAAILCISGGIGIYYAFSGGRQKTTGEFLMGDRKMKMLPTALSILVSFQSAILILGAPAEMYTKGTQYYIYTFGQMLAAAMAAIIYVPLFYPLKITSMYQYLELRFKSRSARLTGTIINIISTLIYTGFASSAPSTALQAVSGFPEWGSYILIGFICTFYTLLGGIKAVIWVDAFQSVIMLAGILAIFSKGVISLGGMSEVWRLNQEWDRIEFFNFNPDPTVRHTFWALIFGAAINWIGTYGASQSSIQRCCTLKSLRDAKLAVLLNCVGIFILLTGSCLAGIVIFAFYAHLGCDPFTNGDIKNKNQLVPYFVMEILNVPGIPGLFIACLFSGALSTLSSNLSSLSTITWEDILKPCFKNKTQSIQSLINRIIDAILGYIETATFEEMTLRTKVLKTYIVLVYGIVGVGITFLVRNLKGTVLQASLSFMGAGSGALNGIIILGAFFPCTNWIGAVFGSITSYGIMLWLGIAKYSVLGTPETLTFPTSTCNEGSYNQSQIEYTSVYATTSFTTYGYSLHTSLQTEQDNELYGLERFYSLSYLWYSAFGTAICIVVGLLTSVVTGLTNPKEVDTKYLIPIFDRLFCCLPKKLRIFLQCGINHQEDDAYEMENEVTSANNHSEKADVINLQKIKPNRINAENTGMYPEFTHL